MAPPDSCSSISSSSSAPAGTGSSAPAPSGGGAARRGQLGQQLVRGAGGDGLLRERAVGGYVQRVGDGRAPVGLQGGGEGGDGGGGGGGGEAPRPAPAGGG